MTVPYQCLSTVVRTLSKVLSSVRAPGPGEEHGFEVNQPRFRFGTGEELRRDILFIHYFLPTSLCISIYSLFPTFFPIHNFFLVNFPILFYVYNLSGILSNTFLRMQSYWYTFQYFPTYTNILVYFPILSYVYNLTGILSNTHLRIKSYWNTFHYLPTYKIILVYFPILSYVYVYFPILTYVYYLYTILVYFLILFYVCNLTGILS